MLLLEQEWRHKPISVTLGVDDGVQLYKCGFQNKLWANEQRFYSQELENTMMYWRDYLLPDGVASFESVQFWKNGWPDDRVPLLIYRNGKHYITSIGFKGPFLFEVTGIAQGDKPTSRKVEYSWKIDLNRCRPGLRLCCADIASGRAVAYFELYDDGWRGVPQS